MMGLVEDAHRKLRAYARRSDPVTSHEAAESIEPVKLVASQIAVYDLIKRHGPCSDVLIGMLYTGRQTGRQSPSGLRTRRSELVKLGLVRDSGHRAKLPSGRRAILWEAVPDAQ